MTSPPIVIGTESNSDDYQRFKADLQRAVALGEVGVFTLARAIPDLDADAGVVAVLTGQGDELEVVASTGYPVEACMGPGRRWAADSNIPMAEAIRKNRPVRIGSPQEWADRYEMSYIPRSKSSAWAAVPLRKANRPVGALLWTYYQPRTFTEDEVRAMEALAAIASDGVARFLT